MSRERKVFELWEPEAAPSASAPVGFSCSRNQNFQMSRPHLYDSRGNVSFSSASSQIVSSRQSPVPPFQHPAGNLPQNQNNNQSLSNQYYLQGQSQMLMQSSSVAYSVPPTAPTPAAYCSQYIAVPAHQQSFLFSDGMAQQIQPSPSNTNSGGLTCVVCDGSFSHDAILSHVAQVHFKYNRYKCLQCEAAGMSRDAIHLHSQMTRHQVKDCKEESKRAHDLTMLTVQHCYLTLQEKGTDAVPGAAPSQMLLPSSNAAQLCDAYNVHMTGERERQSELQPSSLPVEITLDDDGENDSVGVDSSSCSSEVEVAQATSRRNHKNLSSSASKTHQFRRPGLMSFKPQRSSYPQNSTNKTVLSPQPQGHRQVASVVSANNSTLEATPIHNSAAHNNSNNRLTSPKKVGGSSPTKSTISNATASNHSENVECTLFCDYCDYSAKNRWAFAGHIAYHKKFGHIPKETVVTVTDKNRLSIPVIAAAAASTITSSRAEYNQPSDGSSLGKKRRRNGPLSTVEISAEGPEASEEDTTANNDFICDKCTRPFANMRCLRAHRLLHEGSRPFRCSYCRFGFHTEELLNEHKAQKHEVVHQSHKDCESDQTTFDARDYGLNNSDPEEEETTAANNGFICDKCTRLFANLRSLKAHLLLHEGSRPFRCSDCRFGFETEELLNEHKAQKHGGKYFLLSCPTCDERFHVSRQLKQHHFSVHGFPLPSLTVAETRVFVADESSDTAVNQVQSESEDSFLQQNEGSSEEDTIMLKCALCHSEASGMDSIKLHVISHFGEVEQNLLLTAHRKKPNATPDSELEIWETVDLISGARLKLDIFSRNCFPELYEEIIWET